MWNWIKHNCKWSHECWNCSIMWETSDEVSWGMPTFVLRLLSEKFVEPGRFERQLVEDMEQLSEEVEII